MGKALGKGTVIAILAILCCVYAAILIALAPHTATTWVALAFGLAQAVVLALAGLGGKETGAEGLFRAYPKLVVPAMCLLAQLIAGCAFAFVLPGNVAMPSVVGTVLLAASVVVLLGASRAMEHTMSVEDDIADDTKFGRDLILDLRDLRGSANLDDNASHAFDSLIELVRHSDVRGNRSVCEQEREIGTSVMRLHQVSEIQASDIEALTELVRRRNRRLKAGK